MSTRRKSFCDYVHVRWGQNRVIWMMRHFFISSIGVQNSCGKTFIIKLQAMHTCKQTEGFHTIKCVWCILGLHVL